MQDGPGDQSLIDTVVQLDEFRLRRPPVSTDSIADTAMDWAARLRNPDCSASDKADFARWLHASPEHKAAFDETLIVWSLATEAAQRSPLLTVPMYRRSWVSLATAACLLLSFLMVLSLAPQTYTTAKGEQRLVHLEDGSTIFLNTASSVRVKHFNQSRQVELLDGEAFFDITSDPSRPFLVRAAATQIEVVGTAFAVRYGAAPIPEAPLDVMVTEGKVLVEAEHLNSKVLMQAGETVHVPAAGAGSRNLQIVELQPEALAWRNGELVFRDVPLREMLAEISRYVPQQMMLMDDNLGEQRVSAVFSISDQDAILETLKTSFNISWKSVSDELILISR
ncbi:MAG: FecR family protein [Pseudomonadota bacterium]